MGLGDFLRGVNDSLENFRYTLHYGKDWKKQSEYLSQMQGLKMQHEMEDLADRAMKREADRQRLEADQRQRAFETVDRFAAAQGEILAAQGIEMPGEEFQLPPEVAAASRRAGLDARGLTGARAQKGVRERREKESEQARLAAREKREAEDQEFDRSEEGRRKSRERRDAELDALEAERRRVVTEAARSGGSETVEDPVFRMASGLGVSEVEAALKNALPGQEPPRISGRDLAARIQALTEELEPLRGRTRTRKNAPELMSAHESSGRKAEKDDGELEKPRGLTIKRGGREVDVTDAMWDSLTDEQKRQAIAASRGRRRS